MDALKTIGKVLLIIVLLPFALAIGVCIGALMIPFFIIYTPIHMILSVWHLNEGNNTDTSTQVNE